MTLPAVKVLEPSVLYQPELAPSREALLVVLAVAAMLLVLVPVLWAGRMDVKGPARAAARSGGARVSARGYFFCVFVFVCGFCATMRAAPAAGARTLV